MDKTFINFIDGETNKRLCTYVVNCSRHDADLIIERLSIYCDSYIINSFKDICVETLEDEAKIALYVYFLPESIGVVYKSNGENVYERFIRRNKSKSFTYSINNLITNGITNNINFINSLIDNINKREEERDKLLDYYTSSCMKSDINDIKKIKDVCKKIISNCNSHLERITDDY